MKNILITLLISFSAATMAASKIEIKNATIRLPPPGSNTTAMFMTIANNDNVDRALEKISGPISDDFELHEMAMENGKMSMRNVPKIALKKAETTTLKPGGLHVMIFNLKRPLQENEAVEVKLELDHQEKLSIKAIVKKDL